MSLSGTLHCSCCGAEESRGCVRGFLCGCSARAVCLACKKCLNHHHRNCTEAASDLLLRYMDDLTTLRAQAQINIFEYGEARKQNAD